MEKRCSGLETLIVVPSPVEVVANVHTLGSGDLAGL